MLIDRSEYLPGLLESLLTGSPGSQILASRYLRAIVCEHPSHPILLSGIPLLDAALDGEVEEVRLNVACSVAHIAAHAFPNAVSLGILCDSPMPGGTDVILIEADSELAERLMAGELIDESSLAGREVESSCHAAPVYHTPFALPRLMFDVWNGGPEARLNALAELGLMGAGARAAVEDLVQIAGTDCPFTRGVTLLALERIIRG